MYTIVKVMNKIYYNVDRGNYIDILKFVLSLLVVFIHVHPKIDESLFFIVPISRCAVPLFFIMSSYFFFSKLKNTENQNKILLKFVKRNISLYLCWFIVLFFITNESKSYFSLGIIEGFKLIIFDFLFGSTFKASWFLSAQVLAITLIYIFSNFFHFNNKILFTLGIILYLFCCLSSNYYNLFSNYNSFITIYNLYPTIIYNSFPVAIIWIVIGKIICEYNIKKLKHKILYIILCFILLFLEKCIIDKLDCSVATDCYFMLIPLCPLIFLEILEVNKSINYGKVFRNLSTIIYCLHFSLIVLIKNILKTYTMTCQLQTNTFEFYLIICLFSILIALFIQKASKIKHLKVLRNFY